MEAYRSFRRERASSGVVVGLPSVFAEGLISCQPKTVESPTRCQSFDFRYEPQFAPAHLHRIVALLFQLLEELAKPFEGQFILQHRLLEPANGNELAALRVRRPSA